MRQAWMVAALQLRLVARSKAMLAVVLIIPIVFTLMIGGFISGIPGPGTGRSYPIAVVDEDHSFVAAKLVQALAAEPSLRLVAPPAGGLKKLFADKRIDSAVVIPVGYQAAVAAGSQPEVQLVVPPGSNMQVGVGPVVRRYAVTTAQDFLLAEATAGGAGKADPAAVAAAYDQVARERQTTSITVADTPVRRPGAGLPAGTLSMGEYSLGFTVTFVMMLVFMMAGSILVERRQGTWGRLLTAPISRASLMTGYLISFFVAGMTQFALLTVFTTFFFRVHWGPLLPLVTLAAAFVLAAAGAGLFLASIVKTSEQQNTLGVLFVTSTSMLGGVYWSLDLVGDTMRRIGYLTPQAWAMDGFREVVLRNASWGHLVWPLAVLLLYAVIFMTAGLLRVRYE